MAEPLERLQRGFSEMIPHNLALGLRFTSWEPDGWVSALLPYRADLVGNPETGTLHGGVVTSMLDAVCGAAVFVALPRPMPLATLDLRIDYLRTAAAGVDVICRCRCVRVTRHVAFVRGTAHSGDEASPIALAQGSFMVGTKGPPLANRSGA